MMETERRTQVIDFGFEIMKHMNAPVIALWLAEDGWDGGVVLTTKRLDPHQVEVALFEWPQLTISSSLNPN